MNANPRAPFASLPDEQRDALTGALATATESEARRLQCILRLADGRTLQSTADELGVEVSTVSFWIAIYKEGGIEALARPPASRTLAATLTPCQINESKDTMPEAFTARETQALQTLVAEGPSPAAARASALLACAAGKTHAKVAAEMRVHPQTITKWFGLFRNEGVQGLQPSAVRVLPLTKRQSDALLELRRTTQAPRVKLRVSAILERSKGATFEQIAEKLGVRPSSVCEWVRAYREEGIGALRETVPRYRLKTGDADAIKRALLNASSPAEKIDLQMVQARLGGESLVEIAERFGITRQRVHQRLKTYLRRTT